MLKNIETKEGVIYRYTNSYDNMMFSYIKAGHTMQQAIDKFDSIRKTCMKRSYFINVSPRYLVNNWNLIDLSKRTNTLYVMFLTKRVNDMKWILKNKNRFNLSDEKLYQLLKFKDMISDE